MTPSADGLFALDGDVAVVTGGASGFGRAIAAALADRGCKMAILDRDEAGALGAADALGCIGIAADVRDRDAVAAAWQQITGQLGPPGLLVNSAGIGGWSAALGYPEQLWRDVIDINLTGTLNCCLVAAERMAASGGGAIVNMASVMGEVGFPGLVGYAASKGGVIQVTRALAVEFAANGIRVNAVARRPLTRHSRSAIAPCGPRSTSGSGSGRCLADSARSRRSSGRCCSCSARPRPW